MPNADPRVAVPDSEHQYHIDCGPGDIAEYVLLPGDPERIELIAPRFDRIELTRRHREFVTVTGTYRGLRVSAVSTGIGTDNVEIVLSEILAITRHPTFIRIGSCGVLREDIELGELVVTTGAVRLESTTAYYVHEGYPAVADYSVVAALLEAGARRDKRLHAGITATSPGFYGPQGRPIPQLPIRYPGLADEMRRQGVVNFEMEGSAVLILAGLAGCRAGVVCTAFAQRVTGRFLEGEAREQAESDCVDVGLEALVVLSEMDRQVHAAGAARWRPGLWSPPAGA
ncbi:MAG: nucleoside phosphorylase [Chloroflexi bacterium]|nr:nucleoside phosphorylase [Chloroflexota bacterium]